MPSIQETAEKIVKAYYPDDDELPDSIIQALRNERERCAKIAEDHNNLHLSDFYYRNCGLAIADKIRGEP